MRRQTLAAIASVGALGAATGLLLATGITNPTTIALSYLLVVLFIAAATSLRFAAGASLAAALCFNFFFLPPVGTLTISDPNNWVALFAFLVVSIVASQLSASARTKAQEALDRRNELTRLFDLTRDILLTTERDGALAAMARHVARRFELDVVGICLPAASGGWEVNHGGASAPDLERVDDGPIQVRGWTDAEGLRLEVRDDGPGLQTSELDRLFEPFYRGEGFRQRVPGTGMGLAITRGLVAADGGRVWAENLTPRGACFSIAIPAKTRPIAATE